MENTSCKSCNGKIPMAAVLDAQLARGETPAPLPSVAQALMPTNLSFDPNNSGVAIATYAPVATTQAPVSRIRQPEVILPRDEARLIETQPAPRSPIEPRVTISDDFQDTVTTPRTSNRGQRPTLGMASGSLPIAQRYTLSGITTFANAEVFGIEMQDKPAKEEPVKEEEEEKPFPEHDKDCLT